MPRKSILNVIKDILKLLSDKKERSVKLIAYDINSRWETALKALFFMKEIGLVKETRGKKTYITERLFSIR